MHELLVGLGMIATIQYGTTTPPAPPVIQEIVQQTFGEMAPVMLRIAWCESRHRQFNKVGGPIENPVTHDIGIFQINPIWFLTFAKLGLSIYTIEGNIEAAKHILETQGIKAWSSSKKCWGQ